MKRSKFLLTTLNIALLSAYSSAENTTLSTIEVISSSPTNSYNQGYGAYGTSTATGLPLTLRDTPQNVSIVSAQQIKDQNLYSLGKVVQNAVGLYTDIKGSPISGYTVLYARGNRVENFQLDGMPINNVGFGGKGPGDEPNAWSMINTAQYDRVEVLRGATALMDGSGQPSATVSLHRKGPTKTFQGNVDLKIGSFNTHGVETDISGSLNTDGSVRGRLVASYLGGESYQERTSNRNSMLYGIAEWDITPNTTLSAGTTYQYMRDRNSSMFGLVLYDTNGDPLKVDRKYNATINGSYVNYTNLNTFIELKHRFNPDLELKAEYGYAKGHRDQVAGLVGSLFAMNAPWGFMSGGVTVHSDERPEQHNFTLSLNGKYQLWGKEHDAMFGLSGYHLKNDQPRYERQINRIFDLNQLLNFNGVTPQPLGEWVASGEDINRTRQVGGYVATRLHLTEKLALIAGGRYTSFKVKEETQYINGNNSESSVTPYTGIVYDLTDNLSVYSSYAQIFKPQTKNDKNGQYLHAEKGSNIEVGLKGEFFEGKLNGSLSLFETRKSNVGYCAAYLNNGATCEYYDTDPKTKTRGFEIEFNGLITENWALSAGFSHIKGKTPDGKQINPEVPTQQFKLFSSYQWKDLTVGAGLRWQNEMNENIPWGLNNPTAEQEARARSVSRQKPYMVVDAMLGYQLNPHTNITLNVENLFNKTYRTSPNSHSYGTPRNIVGTFSYKF